MGMAYRRMVSSQGHILCALVREKYRAASRKCDMTIELVATSNLFKRSLLSQ